jgi:hypothetical protein
VLKPVTKLPGVVDGDVGDGMLVGVKMKHPVSPAKEFVRTHKFLRRGVPPFSAIGEFRRGLVAGFLDRATDLVTGDLELAEVKIIGKGDFPGLLHDPLPAPIQGGIIGSQRLLLGPGRTDPECLPAGLSIDEFELHPLSEVEGQAFKILPENRVAFGRFAGLQPLVGFKMSMGEAYSQTPGGRGCGSPSHTTRALALSQSNRFVNKPATSSSPSK